MATQKQPRGAKTRNQAYRRERQRQALEYRKLGVSYREIARAMHISPATAHDYVTDALQEITREPAEEVLALELDRYDQLLMGHFTAAAGGDTFATQQVLAIMARIERLHGVESPKEQDGAAETAGMLAQVFQGIADRHQGDPPKG